MLNEKQVIYRKGRYAILSQVQELCLRDGSLTRLHMVHVEGEPEPSRFLRAIANDVAGTFIFNVADIDEDLHNDIRQLPDRDRMGLISMALRQKCLTAAQFRCTVIEKCLVSFRDCPSAPDPAGERKVTFHATTGSADFLDNSKGLRFFITGAQA
jgi:hypothetical protein